MERKKSKKEREKDRRARRKGQDRKKHGKHKYVPPEPECPWSPEELDRKVEAACEFIRQRKRAHARAFGWEVGEHLFFKVYRGNETYLRRIDPTKTDSPADIARRTGIPYSTLYLYLMAAVTRHKLRRAGITPDLDLRHFGVLDELNAHFDAMCAIAEWAGRKGISYRDLRRAVDFWNAHLDEGGRLEDLREDPEEPLRKGKKRKRAKPLSPDLLKASRMLMVVGAWYGKASLSKEHRRKIRARLLRIRSLLVEASP